MRTGPRCAQLSDSVRLGSPGHGLSTSLARRDVGRDQPAALQHDQVSVDARWVRRRSGPPARAPSDPAQRSAARISVRTLLPMVSIATSTSVGMSPGIDRRGIAVIVPDPTPVALSARACEYRGLKDADPNRPGEASNGRSGTPSASRSQRRLPGPEFVAPHGEVNRSQRAAQPAEQLELSQAAIAKPDLLPRPPHGSWRSTR